MSWKDWACICLIIFGIEIFLVGANIYNDVVGWAGVFLTVAGLLSLIILYVYHRLVKSQPEMLQPQNP